MKTWGLGAGLILALSLLGCSGGDAATGSDEVVTGVSLKLTSTGLSGAHYRLTPATITFQNYWQNPDAEALVVESGNEDSLNVPLEAGDYRMTLKPGWQLQKVEADGTLTPAPATLTSEAEQRVSVYAFRTTPATFAFHLGVSGVDVGITVNEGIPPGYAKIHTNGPNWYGVEFDNDWWICCFTSIQEIKDQYPGYTWIYE
jgi:hypothetical protein